MNTIKLIVFNLLTRARNEKGQTMVEYALIVVLIALAAIAAMKYLGGQVNSTLCNAGDRLANP